MGRALWLDDSVTVYQTSDSLGNEMLAIDDVNGDGSKMQVFNPEGTALDIADSIARKEDIFVDDGGQKQYYPFVPQAIAPLSVDGFSGIESLEYRESGFTTNKHYFVDNGSGGKSQVVDYRNNPNSSAR